MIDANLSKYSNLNSIAVKIGKHLDDVKTKYDSNTKITFDFGFSITFNNSETIERIIPNNGDYSNDMKITTTSDGSVIKIETNVIMAGSLSTRLSKIFIGNNSVTSIGVPDQALAHIDTIT